MPDVPANLVEINEGIRLRKQSLAHTFPAWLPYFDWTQRRWCARRRGNFHLLNTEAARGLAYHVDAPTWGLLADTLAAQDILIKELRPNTDEAGCEAGVNRP